MISLGLTTRGSLFYNLSSTYSKSAIKCFIEFAVSQTINPRVDCRGSKSNRLDNSPNLMIHGGVNHIFAQILSERSH